MREREFGGWRRRCCRPAAAAPPPPPRTRGAVASSPFPTCQESQFSRLFLNATVKQQHNTRPAPPTASGLPLRARAQERKSNHHHHALLLRTARAARSLSLPPRIRPIAQAAAHAASRPPARARPPHRGRPASVPRGQRRRMALAAPQQRSSIARASSSSTSRRRPDVAGARDPGRGPQVGAYLRSNHAPLTTRTPAPPKNTAPVVATLLLRRRRAAPLARPLRASASSSDLSAMNGGRGPLVVIDNYDSFTYNLCQVRRVACTAWR